MNALGRKWELNLGIVLFFKCILKSLKGLCHGSPVHFV